MEGQISSIFESQFKRYGSSCTKIQPSSDCANNVDKKNSSVNHVLKNSAIITGISVLAVSPVVILANKGKLPKTLSDIINKNLTKISSKMEKLKDKEKLTGLEMLYYNVLQKTDSVLGAARGLILNVAPLKDVLFEKCLRKIGLGKVCNKITSFFECMAVKMTSKAYKKSHTAFNLMQESLVKANNSVSKNQDLSRIVEINGVSKTLREWIIIAENKSKLIGSSYEHFSPQNVHKRHRKISREFDGLSENVFDRTYGNLKSMMKNPYFLTSFITEELVAPFKLKFTQHLSSKKKLITSTNEDVSKELNTLLAAFESSVNMKDKKSFELLKHLRKTIIAYTSKKNIKSKKEVVEELDKIIADSGAVINNHSYSIISSKKMQKMLGNIRYIVSSDKKGELEELLSIYRHILPKEEFQELEKSVSRFRQSFNTAVNTESDKFVDKMRDLKVGSALTDVGIGLLLPFGTTTLGVVAAETKEKKRSVILKLGVPLLVGVAASTYGALALYSGGASMALGVITSAVANKLGASVDKYFQKRDQRS